MDYRLPPQNTEAEEGVIASLLLDKDLLPEITTILKAEDFYKQDHQAIYQTIVDLYNSRRPVDVITVSDKMGAEWLEYFTKITQGVPTPQNAKHYAGIVKGKSIRRQYIDKARKVIDLAYEGDYETLADFRNDVMANMDIEISNKREDSSTTNILLSTMKKIEERYNSKEPHRLMYGYPWLDKMTGGARNSELTILAARPSVGKTAFASNIGVHIAKHGNSVAMFNLEMDKENLMERIIADEANVDSQRIRNGKTLQDVDWEKIGSAAGEIGEYKINIFDTVFKVEDIRGECRTLKNKGQLDFVIVDYLQLVETMKKTSGPTERVSHLSRQFKLLAKELKVPVWLLSQLNRNNEHDNRRPKLIDLRDSGSIEQDADNVIFLHDANYGKYTEDMDDKAVPIELIIAKQRNGKRDVFTEIGFQKNIQRFMEMEVRHENNNTGTYQKGKQRRTRQDDD
jgi:replicative DNA helicase